MEEIWKPVTIHNMFAYDGGWRYEVSNLGNIRRSGYWGYKHRKYYPSKPMKAFKTKLGRWQVTLQSEGISHTYRVSRLVALSFLERGESAKYVIHLDGNIDNNRADNLAWVKRPFKTPYVKSISKAVRQYTLDGEFVAEYVSASEIQRLLGFDHSTIAACCHRRYRHRTGYGFIWRFTTDDEFDKG